MRTAAALVVLFVGVLPAVSGAAEKQRVRVVRDIAYLSGVSYAANKDKLDLYLPEGRTGVPVIVSFYGGALTQGDKSKETFIGERFAAAGFATAVVNYPLSPRVAHPGHIQDAPASVAWG